MKDTIKALCGYHIKYTKDKKKAVLFDGNHQVMIANVVTDRNELIQNEGYEFVERFTTMKCNQFEYWEDLENFSILESAIIVKVKGVY